MEKVDILSGLIIALTATNITLLATRKFLKADKIQEIHKWLLGRLLIADALLSIYQATMPESTQALWQSPAGNSFTWAMLFGGTAIVLVVTESLLIIWDQLPD